MPSRRIWAISTLITAIGGNVGAQAVLVGSIARDSSDHRLGSAEISIPALRRSATSNYLGEFRMDGLPAGRYAIVVRHVGFAPLADSVDLKAGAQTLREFVLAPTAVTLDSVRVVETERKYISPALRGFEERRKLGFGYFIDDSLLRLHDSDKLASIVRRIPGLNLIPFRSGWYAGSQRTTGTGKYPPAEPCPGANRSAANACGSPRGCWATVYLDGALLYTLEMGLRGSPAPDFNSFNLSDLAGVEFYHGDATLPPQFSSGKTDCGTLLLWTRER